MLWPKSQRDAGVGAPHIPLIKMDVQGYEMNVLAGATALLAARAIETIKLDRARGPLAEGTGHVLRRTVRILDQKRV